MTSGPNRLIKRENFHAAAKSSSVRGASGIRSSPSATRGRSSPSGWATRVARWPMARRPLTVSSTWFWPPRHVRAVSTCSENTLFRVLQFAQLGELQQHVVRIQRRNRKPRHAFAESTLRDVIAEERERRVRDDVEGGGAPAGLVHLLRRQRRVAIDGFEMI